jgi:hypothetical protein
MVYEARQAEIHDKLTLLEELGKGKWKEGFITEFIEKDELNKFEVQGLIQCCEYTFEPGRKNMGDYLEQEGFDVKTPRSTIKMAFQVQLIVDYTHLNHKDLKEHIDRVGKVIFERENEA